MGKGKKKKPLVFIHNRWIPGSRLRGGVLAFRAVKDLPIRVAQGVGACEVVKKKTVHKAGTMTEKAKEAK